MSKIQENLLNLNAKKIQRSIKNYIVIKNYSKFKSKFDEFDKEILNSTHDIVNTKLDIDFDKFCKFIRNKEVIEVTDNFLKSFKFISKAKLELSPKILLSSILTFIFSDEMLGNDKDLNHIDRSLKDWTTVLVTKLKNIKNEDLIKIKLLLNNFNIIFNQWKNYDKSKLVESIIISYNHRCEHIEKIKNDTYDENEKSIFENMQKESKIDMIKVLELQKEDLLLQIKRTDPSIDINYIRENSSFIMNQMNQSYQEINQSVSNTMKIAYYDMLTEEIKSNNMLPIFDLLKEIGNRLLVLVPKKQSSSFNDKFNENKLIDIISSNTWNEDLIDHIKFLCDSIFALGAPIDDQEIKEWKESVVSLTKGNFEENLPLILVQVQEKIDKIYSLISMMASNN